MRLVRPCIITVLIALLPTTFLAGQLCRGSASFSGQPIQLSLAGQFADKTSTLGAGIGVGGRRVFGDVMVQGERFEKWDAAANSFAADAGVELSPPRLPLLQVCPMAEVQRVLGPNKIYGAGMYRETNSTFGVSVGVAVTRTSAAVSIIPTGSYAHLSSRTRLTYTTATPPPTYQTRGSDVVTFGLGIVFGQNVSLTSTVSRLTWSGGSSKTVSFRFTLVPGGPKTSVVNRRPTPCAGSASGDSTVYDLSQVNERPHLKSVPELRYPDLQRSEGIAGRVIVSLVVGADGAPEMNSAQIVKTLDPALDDEAVTWVGGATYWPACRDGRPVRARIVQPVDFCPQGCPQDLK